MLLCVTTTTNEQLKIELLSQWKLEAESCNFRMLPSSVQSPLVWPRVTQLAVHANSPSEHLVVSGETLKRTLNLPEASQCGGGKSKKNKEEKTFIWY